MCCRTNTSTPSSMFQTVLGVLSLSFPIFSLFRSLLQMKLLVAPESTRTCLLVVKCKGFKRVGIHSNLYLLAKTIFNCNFNRHAQTNRVASFKNPHLDWLPFQSLLQLPCWWWKFSDLLLRFDPCGPKYSDQGFCSYCHQKFHCHHQYLLGGLWNFSSFCCLVCFLWVYLGSFKMWSCLLQVKQHPSLCSCSTSFGAVVPALPWVWWFLFPEWFLSAHVSMATRLGNSILTPKIFVSSTAVNPPTFFWGGFLGVSPWMTLMF